MSSELFSLLLWCSYQPQTETTQLRVVHVDANDVMHIRDGKFLLRVSVDTGASLVRCMIRHTTTGREAHMQGGLNLPAFVKDCLLAEETLYTKLLSPMEVDQMEDDEQERLDQEESM